MPNSLAICAIGLPLVCANRTASRLNSAEKSRGTFFIPVHPLSGSSVPQIFPYSTKPGEDQIDAMPSCCIASHAVECKVRCFFERALAGAEKHVSQAQLMTEILERSVAQTWDEARSEWSLYEIYEADEPESCLCGHFPIIELCVLRNRRNGIQVTVGNWCVKHFLGLPSDKIFQAVKRIRRDLSNSLNPEALQHAFERQWITEWERDFYLSTMRKRTLTEKQSAKKLQINNRVLRHVRRQR